MESVRKRDTSVSNDFEKRVFKASPIDLVLVSLTRTELPLRQRHGSLL
jgi:hypothetical protein